MHAHTLTSGIMCPTGECQRRGFWVGVLQLSLYKGVLAEECLSYHNEL